MLESEMVSNLTFMSDSAFFNMVAAEWIQGDEWKHQNQTTLWIVHAISNTPQPHIHVKPNAIIMHSHGHNVLDKPENLRRFSVRCVCDMAPINKR